MSDSDLTALLGRSREGDPAASEHLVALLYAELRAMAGREMASERPDHTLQPTALVHEAFLRLVPPSAGGFQNRAHFLGAASIAIRRVLVEHARSRARIKRGGGRVPVDLQEVEPVGPIRDEWLLALDEALERLAVASPLAARIVDLRFFGGMTVSEVASTLAISESSVERAWRMARAWLRGELQADDERPDRP